MHLSCTYDRENTERICSLNGGEQDLEMMWTEIQPYLEQSQILNLSFKFFYEIFIEKFYQKFSPKNDKNFIR